MSDETIEKLRTILEWVLENTDDDEIHYKLRTALQLVEVQRSDVDSLSRAVENDEDLEQRLRQLGYIE